jgi:hypothetical protein
MLISVASMPVVFVRKLTTPSSTLLSMKNEAGAENAPKASISNEFCKGGD